MKKFKEGDKVKLLKNAEDDWAVYARSGDQGVVTGFKGDLVCHVKMDDTGITIRSWVGFLELVEEAEKPSGKIKSDGGSSSYYDLPISDKLLEALNKRREDGQCYVKTEDLIDELFDNDFDFGTLFKSLVRGYLQTKGEGKACNDLEYEMNKVVYYANKIKEK